jgi:hypothetical protein
MLNLILSDKYSVIIYMFADDTQIATSNSDINVILENVKGHWQPKFLLAISILLDNLTMKILSFPSRTF